MRRGTTLTEVLMSLLIMGIGVVALASLFPISILRTVRATQLTNATVHRLNIESMLDGRWPHLLHDPDGDANYYTATPNGPNALEHYDSVYVVDPLGWWINDSDPSTASFADTFGNDGTNPSGIERFNGGQTVAFESTADPTTTPPTPPQPVPFIDSLDAAWRFVSLPDSWVTLRDDNPVGQAPFGDNVTLTEPPEIEVDQSTMAPLSEHRVILFDTNRGSLVRTVTQINGATVTWQDDVPVSFEIERVRLEVRDWRYTWLLTVRKDAEGAAYPEIAIFFSRGFDPQDERVYSARIERGQSPTTANQNPPVLNGWDLQPGDAGYDDDADGTIDNPEERGNGDDIRTAYVFWTGTDPPRLKRGAFLFDMSGRWYSIANFRDSEAGDPPPPAGSNMTVVLLGSEIAEDSTAGVVLPRGVIEVFPLEKRELLTRDRTR